MSVSRECRSPLTEYISTCLGINTMLPDHPYVHRMICFQYNGLTKRMANSEANHSQNMWATSFWQFSYQACLEACLTDVIWCKSAFRLYFNNCYKVLSLQFIYAVASCEVFLLALSMVLLIIVCILCSWQHYIPSI